MTPAPKSSLSDGVARAPAQTSLDIRALSKAFGSTHALEHVDLQVASGEFLTLLGPSGSGKTTLLKIISGFEKPTAGQVLLRGRDISQVPPAERGIGLVFQHYALFPHMSVKDNISYGLRLRRWSKKERQRRVAELLELLRLDGFEDRYPHQLSGGQQQRVALGRALAYHPEIILMDEPLGALDRALRLEMAAELRRIHRDLDATIIHVTHDQQEALALSDRIAIMRQGRVVGLGTPGSLYYRPPNRFVAEFFSNCNLLPVERYDSREAGMAVVRCRGEEIVCQSMVLGSGRVHLAVRPRSLRREPVPGGLTLRGIVKETVLLGDEREILVEIEDIGKVLVISGAHESSDLSIGATAEFHASPSEAILVPED